jgi:hypothetical protein
MQTPNRRTLFAQTLADASTAKGAGVARVHGFGLHHLDLLHFRVEQLALPAGQGGVAGGSGVSGGGRAALGAGGLGGESVCLSGRVGLATTGRALQIESCKLCGE